MKKKKLVIIGYGGMGSYHANLIANKINCLSLAGIYDIDEERRLAAQRQGLYAYGSLAEVLADSEVEILLIATPNDSHMELSIQAMQAGKHVICEKPVAMSSTELTKMIETANSCQRVFTVHQNRRWDEDFCTIKRIYDQNELNGVYRIESRVHGSRGIPGDWRGKKEQGGGMILDWGVHIIDQMLQLVPEKVSSVYCRMDHITNHEVDDGFTLQLHFENGTSALLEVGTHHFIELPRWYMVGRDGAVKIDDFSGHGTMVKVRSWEDKDVKPVRTGAGFTKTMAPRTAETVDTLSTTVEATDIGEFYQNVCDVIDGAAQLTVRHDQVLRVMQLMEAAFESDRRRQAVQFE